LRFFVEITLMIMLKPSSR